MTLEEHTKELKKHGSAVVPVSAVLLFLAATVISAIVLEYLQIYTSEISAIQSKNASLTDSQRSFAIYDKTATENHLEHVIDMFQRFGYRRVGVNEEWEILWAHTYPFLDTNMTNLKTLRPHQKVNHIPGCGFITNKVDLSTTELPFLPRAFRLPAQQKDFLRYAHEHPDALFVEKHNEHRQIVISAPRDINLTSNSNFVQEFIQRPFLVDGYKFDIGVYVLFTSIDPLRIYIYTGDVLFRFCPVKYHPFNASIVDQYVVGDDYLPIWEVPSLMKYYNQYGGSMRQTFDAYVRDQQLDPAIIWRQVNEIVCATALTKEFNIAGILRSYKTRSFFDLMRFDFIIDEQLCVYLMEANMSPNLSSAHYKPNALLYKQILYSVFNLVDIGTPFTSSKSSAVEVEEIVTAEKNLATDLNRCVQYNCLHACNLDECSLCLPCLSGSEYQTLATTHKEHLHRINMKRIFPKPILDRNKFDINLEIQNMSRSNKWMTRWFYEKCMYDSSWCS